VSILIRVDQQLVNQYFKYIKDAGYKYWKDDMGFYFEAGIKRFSIIKVGPFLDVYYNKKENGKYTLQEKITGKIQLLECLQWIYQRK